MHELELYHHGILGQKWGVRRFQNADGTRTAAGKKRYSDTSSAKKLTVEDFRTKSGALTDAGMKKYQQWKSLRTDPKYKDRVNKAYNDFEGRKAKYNSELEKKSDEAYARLVTNRNAKNKREQEEFTEEFMAENYRLFQQHENDLRKAKLLFEDWQKELDSITLDSLDLGSIEKGKKLLRTFEKRFYFRDADWTNRSTDDE